MRGDQFGSHSKPHTDSVGFAGYAGQKHDFRIVFIQPGTIVMDPNLHTVSTGCHVNVKLQFTLAGPVI